MRRNRVALCVSLGLFSATALGCSFEPARVEVPRDEMVTVAAPPPKAVLPRPEGGTSWYYRGVITALGSDWLEIGAGWQGSVETDHKTNRSWVRENGDTKKIKRISTAGTKPGGDRKGVGDDFTYWLSDLNIGDTVSIASCESNGDEWTTQFTIQRRPGGIIPPIRGEQLGLGAKPTYHLSYQAEQDWEEKGIPIPKAYLDKDGRNIWTNPPYPPAAPMPRVGISREAVSN